jgi:hypothetical protein
MQREWSWEEETRWREEVGKKAREDTVEEWGL